MSHDSTRIPLPSDFVQPFPTNTSWLEKYIELVNKNNEELREEFNNSKEETKKEFTVVRSELSGLKTKVALIALLITGGGTIGINTVSNWFDKSEPDNGREISYDQLMKLYELEKHKDKDTQ